MQVEAYAIYRKFYGFLCHDGFNFDDLGWYEIDDIAKKGVSILWFKSKAEASTWYNRLPMSKRGWFSQCQWAVKKVRITIETEADYVWD